MSRLAISSPAWRCHCCLATGNIGRGQEHDTLRLTTLQPTAPDEIMAVVADEKAAVTKELGHEVDDGDD